MPITQAQETEQETIQASEWTLSHPSPGKWQLTNPRDPLQVLYLYVLTGQGQRVRRVGATAQTGDFVPPLPRTDFDGMDFLARQERERAETRRAQAEVDFIEELFRVAIANQRTVSKRRQHGTRVAKENQVPELQVPA